MNILIEIAGWTGSVLIVFAYAFLNAGRLTSHSAVYHILNIAGSFLLVINTFYNSAVPAAALNVVWMLIGTYSLFASIPQQRMGG